MNTILKLIGNAALIAVSIIAFTILVGNGAWALRVAALYVYVIAGTTVATNLFDSAKHAFNTLIEWLANLLDIDSTDTTTIQ